MEIYRGTLYLDVVEYDESMGKYEISEDLKSTLSSLTLDEQTEYFFANTKTTLDFCSYGKSDGGRAIGRTLSVWECSDVGGVVVDGGIIVGLIVNVFLSGEQPVFIGQTVCTYSCTDEDGTGSTDRDDYLTVITK